MAIHSTRNSIPRQLILAAATLLTGLSAGFFATYEYSVTRALAEVNDTVYVTTFQAINATVRSLEFGIIFFGSIIALVVALVVSRSNRTALILLSAALLSYLTMLVITFSIHIPLNESLAAVQATTESAASAARATFETRWNAMHCVRTIAVLVSFALTILTLIQRPQ